jgi:hydroxymethylpyrimidine pyrophosphatase-like HAD family hydrolase
MLNFEIGDKIIKVPKFSLIEHPIMSVSEVKVKLKSNIREITNEHGQQEQPHCDSNHVDIELTFNNSNKSTGLDQLMKDYDKTY